MNVKLIKVGKTKSKFLVEEEAKYEKRIKYYCKFSEVTITNTKYYGKNSINNLIFKEGEKISAHIPDRSYVVLLDDRGDKLSSTDFAEFLRLKISSSNNELVFIIGGAFGVSKDIYQRADSKLSLSNMTFSYQMIRLIFKEQLYRAFSIIRGDKYHHA